MSVRDMSWCQARGHVRSRHVVVPNTRPCPFATCPPARGTACGAGRLRRMAADLVRARRSGARVPRSRADRRLRAGSARARRVDDPLLRHGRRLRPAARAARRAPRRRPRPRLRDDRWPAGLRVLHRRAARAQAGPRARRGADLRPAAEAARAGRAPRSCRSPMDDEGLDLDALEAELAKGGAVSFLYTIPTFQNPSGRTLGDRAPPAARRARRRRTTWTSSRTTRTAASATRASAPPLCTSSRAASGSRSRRRSRRPSRRGCGSAGSSSRRRSRRELRRPRRLDLHLAAAAARRRSSTSCIVARRVRAEPRARPRAAARPAGRDARRARRARCPAARAGAAPRAATSSGSTSPRASMPPSCSRRATEAGVTFVKGSDFFPAAEGGAASARLAFSLRDARADRRGRRASSPGCSRGLSRKWIRAACRRHVTALRRPRSRQYVHILALPASLPRGTCRVPSTGTTFRTGP